MSPFAVAPSRMVRLPGMPFSASIALAIRLCSTVSICTLSPVTSGRPGRSIDDHRHAVAERACARRVGGGVEQPHRRQPLLAHGAAADEFAQPAHHGARAVGFGHDLVHRRRQLPFGIAAFEQQLARAGVGRNGRQRLVQLVRQRGRQFARGRGAQAAVELELLVAQLLFGGPALLDGDAEKQSRQREREHQELEVEDLAGLVAAEQQRGDEADLHEQRGRGGAATPRRIAIQTSGRNST